MYDCECSAASVSVLASGRVHLTTFKFFLSRTMEKNDSFMNLLFCRF